MDTNIVRDITDLYFNQVIGDYVTEVSADLALKASKEAGKRAGVLAGLSGGDPKVAAKARKKRSQAERLYTKQAKKRVVNVSTIKEDENVVDETSHLETDMKKRRKNNEKAVEDMKKTDAYKSMTATAAKKFDEALDPVGKEDADVDNDGKKNTNADKYLLKRRKTIGKAIATQEAKEVKRWWDDDGDGKGYEEGEVSGKFKKKKKIKEGFSNWREDLIEVADKIKKDKSEDVKITEKKVNNKIDINPKLNVGEAVEELGGTLLEMVEIDEVDFVIESVYDELLGEGYEEDDIEEALEYALTEAKVTFGHDTDKPYQHKKKTGAGQLVSAVGRLARQKLSSKVLGAKASAKAAVARGARKVAKGALGVARKMEGGDKAPKTTERKPSTYRGAGAGTKEKVSSGSYTPPTKKKVEKPSDPWEGSASTPPKAKTKKTAAPKAKAPAASKPKRKRTSKLDSLLADIRNESVEINEMPYQVMGSPDGGKEKKIGKPVKSKKYADARAAELADTHKSTGGKYRSQYVEEIEINEKTLTAAEKKKREEIAQSMNLADFERRYPGRGMEVKMATATKLAKKIAEQAMELQPKTQSQTQQSSQDAKSRSASQRAKANAIQLKTKELATLKSTPAGTSVSSFG